MTRAEESNLECKCEVIRLEDNFRIFILPLSEDKIGKYIPYCSLRYHRGIIEKESEKKCLNRKCKHYKVFREDKEDICL
jgi:hypothetical protein